MRGMKRMEWRGWIIRIGGRRINGKGERWLRFYLIKGCRRIMIDIFWRIVGVEIGKGMCLKDEIEIKKEKEDKGDRKKGFKKG